MSSEMIPLTHVVLILKWLLKELDERVWTRFIWLIHGPNSRSTLIW
jgi:hypothetical protein